MAEPGRTRPGSPRCCSFTTCTQDRPPRCFAAWWSAGVLASQPDDRSSTRPRARRRLHGRVPLTVPGGQVRSMLSLISYLGSGECRDRYLGVKTAPTNVRDEQLDQARTFANGLADKVLSTAHTAVTHPGRPLARVRRRRPRTEEPNECRHRPDGVADPPAALLRHGRRYPRRVRARPRADRAPEGARGARTRSS